VEWWPIFWLFVILKIPLLAALWIVWWALRAEPAPADEDRADDDGRGPDHPRPRHPGPSRRGPHSSPSPPAPSRVRARSKHRLVRHR
jgi:hypothetical protein